MFNHTGDSRMTDPLAFNSTTPRHELPMLFAGQSQKEATVNGVCAIADVLLHPAVEGEAGTPPDAPAEGQCWLVGTGASGAFEGRDGCLAGFQAGSWIFAPPIDGMRVFDRSTGQSIPYIGEWRREEAPPAPSGGTTVDLEARTAIVALIQHLRRTGALPAI
jgi:hypothetical protein